MRPDLAILVSTVLWGTIWIPVRQLNTAGWDQGLAFTISCGVAVAAMLPVLVLQKRWSQIADTRIWILGLIFGFGTALYLEAIVRGDVARGVLLFYLMPVWSAILGRIFNGDPITHRRVIGIVLGLSGLAVIFYDGSGIPLPSGAADFMALTSGMIWAIAFSYSEKSKAFRTTFGQVFSSLVLLGPVLFLLSLIPGNRDSLAVSEFSSGQTWLIALALIWLLPAITLTLFGAGRLQPSQVSIFLMIEVAVALVSAAVLLNEPFGLRETIGATLIIGASFAEFVGVRRH